MNFQKYMPEQMHWSQKSMRQAIGYIGILLPLLLLAGNFAIGKCSNIQDSISHYYFTVMGDVFVGTLCAVAFFLFTYKGYDVRDNASTSVAAACALGVGFFPTRNDSAHSCAMTPLPSYDGTSNLHFIFAVMFFLTLASISAFLFTKSDRTPEEKKLKSPKRSRNRIYRICAAVIVLCIILIWLVFRYHWLPSVKPVFWLEWIALIAFGASWLVKGEVIFSDKKKDLVTDPSMKPLP